MSTTEQLQPKNNSSSTKLYLYLAFFIYVILIGYSLNIHEQWRDEAQAWLLVRDLSLVDLLSILRTEGHPPVWYMIIMPFAKMGAPYFVQNVIAVVIMAAATYLLLFKTKLPLIIKLALPFSYYFLYEYSFFARSYCLIAFFAMAIISLYEYRFQKPWLYALCIVGLFNTHVLMYTFCGMLVLTYLWELYQQKQLSNPKLIGPGVLMSVGGLYLLPYLFMAKMTDEFAKTVSDSTERIFKAIEGGIAVDNGVALALILLLVCAALMYKSPKALIVLVGGLIAVFYILGYKYPSTGFRHKGTIFFILLVSLYIGQVESKEQLSFKNIAYSYWLLFVICLVQLIPSFKSYAEDNSRMFSGAKDAATYLQENDYQSKTIVGHQAWAASAVIPYLGGNKQFYYGECERFGSFYRYDSCFIAGKWAYAVEYTVDKTYENFKDSLQNVVMIFNYPVGDRGMQFMDLLYQTPEEPIQSDEQFYIYKFKDGLK